MRMCVRAHYVGVCAHMFFQVYDSPRRRRKCFDSSSTVPTPADTPHAPLCARACLHGTHASVSAHTHTCAHAFHARMHACARVFMYAPMDMAVIRARARVARTGTPASMLAMCLSKRATCAAFLCSSPA
eukprot:Tamp_19452.p3 GENE.Tamp_19452~~Tamp_19452.p3  ORF type:complete len:129 (-),score=9.86 Tamp_19452:282-668(-)